MFGFNPAGNHAMMSHISRVDLAHISRISRAHPAHISRTSRAYLAGFDADSHSAVTEFFPFFLLYRNDDGSTEATAKMWAKGQLTASYKVARDMPEMCPRYVRDMPEMCPRYARDVPESTTTYCALTTCINLYSLGRLRRHLTAHLLYNLI